MKHVHAEVMKELADDDSLSAQVWHDFLEQWEDLEVGQYDSAIGIISRQVTSKFRIKPQPKAISWTCFYDNGDSGKSWTDKTVAQHELLPHCKKTWMVEVRDDGTAHLHKVES